jgi:hypothetical protein
MPDMSGMPSGMDGGMPNMEEMMKNPEMMKMFNDPKM